jgi:hypothetical protein
MALCDLEDCPHNSGGACLKGRGEDCPHLLDEARQNSSQPDSLSPIEESVQSTTDALYSGAPLEIQEAREFARRGRATVVVLVGLSECGKTSLIARIHQQFMAGPVGSYSFAGSRTLLRFEELNWLATIESGVGKPLMDRSSRFLNNTFLHFSVQRAEGDARHHDLLLNDISGETVEDAVGMQSVCDGLIALARADHVVVVVDGGALADLDVCYDHVGKIRDFVQRVVQSGQIGPDTVLHLVISKRDLLTGGEPVAAQLEADFQRVFADRVGGFHRWRVAARPSDGSQPTEREIATLFESWLETSLRYPSATEAEIWKLPRAAQWGVVEALESATVSEEVWPNVIQAMLRADASVAVREIVNVAGQPALDGALKWTKEEDDKLPGDAWRDALAELAQTRLARESLSPLELAFAVAFVRPQIAEGIPASRPDVQALAALPLHDLPSALQLPAAFFLVALGLMSEGSTGGPLLARGFVAVHSALATRTEPPNSWRLLQRHLPEFAWWEWDRCDKLREATRYWFRRNRSSQQTFLHAATTEADRRLAQRLIS